MALTFAGFPLTFRASFRGEKFVASRPLRPARAMYRVKARERDAGVTIGRKLSKAPGNRGFYFLTVTIWPLPSRRSMVRLLAI